MELLIKPSGSTKGRLSPLNHSPSRVLPTIEHIASQRIRTDQENVVPYLKPYVNTRSSFTPIYIDQQETIEQAAESMIHAKSLLDFLSQHKGNIENDPDLLKKFEDLTAKTLAKFNHPNSKLYQLLVEEGWIDTGYQKSLFRALDEETLSLALGTVNMFTVY